MYFVHDVPGRLRIKIAYLKNNPYRLKQLEQALAIEGVHKVKTSKVTGSIVVEYDPLTVEKQRLFSILRAEGYNVDSAKPVNHEKKRDQEKIVMDIGKATVSWFAGQILEANGLSYIAAFI